MREGWEYKKLGEVGEVITGSTPSTKDADNYNSSDVCFVKPSDIPKEGIGLLSDSEFYISKKAYGNSRKLPRGSVLTTCIGIIGKVGILTIDATCNQQINAIIPHTDVSSSFLAYSILSKRHYLEHIANAPVVPIINKKEFSNTIIPVPPLSEQEHIVSELDLLQSIIEKKKAQLKEYDQLAQSIFYDMFGDPVTNEKGWEVKKLGEICEHKKSILRASNKFKPNEQINYIDISSIDNSQNKITSTTSYIFGDAPSRAQQIVKKGDILVSLVRPNLKNIAMVVEDNYQLVASSGFCVLRTMVEINNIYVFYVVQEESFTKHLLGRVQGANYPAVREDDVKSYNIPLPPLSLQQQFASKIKAIERQKSLIQQSISETETLFNSRMDYWFN